MRKILLIFLLPVLWACNNNKDVSIVNSFKINQPLTHNFFDVENSENELLNPSSIAVSGNTMTTWNLMTPNVFTTIDIATERVIKHWGTRGQGPNEFITVGDIFNNYLETGINIWDRGAGKLYFSSNSDLESNSANFQEIHTGLNLGDRVRSYSAVQIDTLLFFALEGNDNKRFTLIDVKNNTRKEIGDFPPEDKNIHLSVFFRNMAYNGRIRYNNSQKKLVYVSIASEMFEIYKVNSSDVELAIGNYSTIPKYEERVAQGGASRIVNEFVTNGKGRNFSVTISDENIFILYQDYKKTGTEEDRQLINLANMVLVFDWNGKPVKIYELDSFVKTITYDKERNRLWAIHDNPNPEIIYFEL